MSTITANTDPAPDHGAPSTTLTTAPAPAAVQSQPTIDLRHMTSSASLAPPPVGSPTSKPRTASHGTAGSTAPHKLGGTHSPSSIPSSPTSVHSSTSAIFERDIEPMASTSLLSSALSTSSTSTQHQLHPHPHPATDPHRIPRARATEALDQGVPSVLDSAAELLTAATADDADQDLIAVVTPAPPLRSGSGVGSPMAMSRSPSPGPGAGAGAAAAASTGSRRTSMLLNVPISTLISVTPSTTASSVPHSPRSGSLGLSGATSAGSASPTRSPVHTAGLALPSPSDDLTPTTGAAGASSPSPRAASMHAAHPHASHTVTKRLSFLSYADLVASTPASTAPLSSFTNHASSLDPPPHLPSVEGYSQGGYGCPQGYGPGQQQQATGISMSPEGLGMDGASLGEWYASGEWEREGLGMGLQERLEVLMAADAPKA